MSTNVAELRQQAKLPAKQAGGGTVAKFFEANKASLSAVLPKHVSPERMLKIALGAMRTTPKLMECTTESLFGAVVQCAQLGLEPNTPMGHAYLIPFRDNRKNRTDVQVIIGYRGLIDLARRSGQIVSIAAHAVYQHDKFEYEYGLEEKLVHVPAEGNRGEITHFYAVAKLKDGGHAFEVMTRAKVEQIRDESQNYKFARDKAASVWGKHFEEMGRKTVIRRLFKYLPVSIELATAAILDGKAATGESQGLDGVLQGEFSVVDDDYTDGEDGGVMDQGAQVETAGNNVVNAECTTNTETGELEYFDPEIHVSPDNKNKNGTYRRKPQPRQQQGGGVTLQGLVDKMKACQDKDALDAIYDLRGELSDDDQGALDGYYETRSKQMANAGGGITLE